MGDGIEIRPAVAADAPAAAAIARAAYARYIADLGPRIPPMQQDFPADIAAGRVWVLTAGGAVAGYLVLRARPGDWLLENVAVAPDRQGEGFGRRLIEAAERMARDGGAPGLALYTHVRMTANRALYARAGYAEAERRVEDGMSRVFFRKPL